MCLYVTSSCSISYKSLYNEDPLTVLPCIRSSSYCTWLLLPGFGQVRYAGVRTHEHVAGVQRPLQEELLGLGQVDATQWSLGQSVGGDQSQAVHPHLVDTVYRLEDIVLGEVCLDL